MTTEEQVAEDTYNQGYADGKEKAHWEVRELASDPAGHDTSICGCDPCITIRAVRSPGPSDRMVRWWVLQTQKPRFEFACSKCYWKGSAWSEEEATMVSRSHIMLAHPGLK